MKAKIVDGVVQIDVMDLVDGLSPEDKRQIAQSLCADEYLIKAVLEIVSDESRFGYYFNDDEKGSWWFDPRSVQEMREKLIPLLPVAARQAVLEALRQRDSEKARAERHSSWAWKMYHAWPDGHWQSKPRLPEWMPPQIDETHLEAEADALIGTPEGGK